MCNAKFPPAHYRWNLVNVIACGCNLVNVIPQIGPCNEPMQKAAGQIRPSNNINSMYDPQAVQASVWVHGAVLRLLHRSLSPSLPCQILHPGQIISYVGVLFGSFGFIIFTLWSNLLIAQASCPHPKAGQIHQVIIIIDRSRRTSGVKCCTEIDVLARAVIYIRKNLGWLLLFLFCPCCLLCGKGGLAGLILDSYFTCRLLFPHHIPFHFLYMLSPTVLLFIWAPFSLSSILYYF